MKTIKLIVILAISAFIGALVACNTVHGAGEDLQAGGHAVSKAATNVQNS